MAAAALHLLERPPERPGCALAHEAALVPRVGPGDPVVAVAVVVRRCRPGCGAEEGSAPRLVPGVRAGGAELPGGHVAGGRRADDEPVPPVASLVPEGLARVRVLEPGRGLDLLPRLLPAGADFRLLGGPSAIPGDFLQCFAILSSQSSVQFSPARALRQASFVVSFRSLSRRAFTFSLRTLRRKSVSSSSPTPVAGRPPRSGDRAGAGGGLASRPTRTADGRKTKSGTRLQAFIGGLPDWTRCVLESGRGAEAGEAGHGLRPRDAGAQRPGGIEARTDG